VRSKGGEVREMQEVSHLAGKMPVLPLKLPFHHLGLSLDCNTQQEVSMVILLHKSICYSRSV
jgi:hypothetical protein